MIENIQPQSRKVKVTPATLFSSSPEDLLSWLETEFPTQIPEQVDSIEEMQEASKILLRLGNQSSYLTNLSSHAKIATRNAKRSGDKAAYEDMVDRKEVIANQAAAIEKSYNAISRAVTIHIENNRELRMNSFDAAATR